MSVLLLFVALAWVHGQSRSNPARQRAVKTLTNPEPPQTQYLTGPLDLNRTNLGREFKGHDIRIIVQAIQLSPALFEKSEFETTSAFEARRARFADQPLYGNVMPNGYFAFVLEANVLSNAFSTYDADSQTLEVKLYSTTGGTTGYQPPHHCAISLRYVQADERSYIGSNAFGAAVEVRQDHSDEYGVVLNEDTWLFGSSNSHCTFSYLFAMAPDEARDFKDHAKLLLICRLMQPTILHDVYLHQATLHEPYETIADYDYLEAIPEQLWIFNDATGEVVRKISESSIAGEYEQQLNLKLRQTPLILEITSSRWPDSLQVYTDGQFQLFSGTTEIVRAKNEIRLVMMPKSLPIVSFKLNGKPYTPNWTGSTGLAEAKITNESKSDDDNKQSQRNAFVKDLNTSGEWFVRAEGDTLVWTMVNSPQFSATESTEGFRQLAALFKQKVVDSERSIAALRYLGFVSVRLEMADHRFDFPVK